MYKNNVYLSMDMNNDTNGETPMVYRIFVVNAVGGWDSEEGEFESLTEAMNYIIDTGFELDEGFELRIVPTMTY
jgi:hypothetical protein